MKFDFSKKNVIVTGGASGIGKAIALEFAKSGANVVVVDVNREKAQSVATELSKYGTKVFSSVTDVTKFEQVEALMKSTYEALGSIDILINSAGICILSPILDMDIDDLDRVIDIDLKGTVYCCKSALKYMLGNKYGRIINMSSIAAKLSGENASVYSSVKNAIISLSASLGREFAKDGITVNAILPGIIRTSMWEGMLESMTGNDDSKKDEVFSMYEASIPQGKAQEPIDIANMTLFLCSDEAKCVTSQNIGVDGGHTY